MKKVYIISWVQQCFETYYGNYVIESIHASEQGAKEHLAKLPPTQKNTYEQDFEVEEEGGYKITQHQLLD